jgi:hypothetical protein
VEFEQERTNGGYTEILDCGQPRVLLLTPDGVILGFGQRQTLAYFRVVIRVGERLRDFASTDPSRSRSYFIEANRWNSKD